ncbi:hypothetical protein [Nocardia pneumoniae]|nr:hypothetical protein [Nocardia pneumoniae]
MPLREHRTELIFSARSFFEPVDQHDLPPLSDEDTHEPRTGAA